MYIAMNRFKIERGKESVFENLWLSRDSHLKNVSGFVSFNLLKAQVRKISHYMLLIACGIRRKIFQIGLNRKLSELLIKMQVVILIFILAILFLKVLK